MTTCYVHSRNDFFVLPTSVVALAKSRKQFDFKTLDEDTRQTIELACRTGVIQSPNLDIHEGSYRGPGLIGSLEPPHPSFPYVLNCFSTAHCPLKCQYCYADDLMMQLRAGETHGQIADLKESIRQIPAMTYVITGGDPITSPERSFELIKFIAKIGKPLVFDTSGVGNISKFIKVLKDSNSHVRISFDSTHIDTNNKLRPLNVKYKNSYNGLAQCNTFEFAMHAIDVCINNDIPTTVQTVVTNVNETELEDIARILIKIGVKNWVLHYMVEAGAGLVSYNRISPGSRAKERIKSIFSIANSEKWPLDIRCTYATESKNSVLLLNSNGDLYTEGHSSHGKRLIYRPGDPTDGEFYWKHVNRMEHAKRYLNLIPWLEGV